MKKENQTSKASESIDIEETILSSESQKKEFPKEFVLSFDWLFQRVRAIKETEHEQVDPLIIDESSFFGKFVRELNFNDDEIVLAMVALAATLEPSILQSLKTGVSVSKGVHIGGNTNRETGVFNPTLRTVIFLLAGNNPEKKARVIQTLHSKSKPFTLGLVKAVPLTKESSFLDYQVIFNDQFLDTVLFGVHPRLDSDPSFPVRKSLSKHRLTDVVVKEKTTIELLKLQRFARNMIKLWEMEGSSKVRRNYLCVFSGDPGTGKSFSAEAIGNELQLPVYRVNFAQMISKYIGETEKNLEVVFDRFNKQPSILFFDEAESIFSKRTEVKDSHDQYANNLQSYLLQKVEDFEGIIVLATNVQDLAQYFDKAFQRRIRSIVSFEFPDHEERLPIWENSLFKPFTFGEGVIEEAAKNYQLSGGSIYNVVSDAVIEALDNDTDTITKEMLESAMKDEFKKTGRKMEVCTDEMVNMNPERRYGIGYEKRKNF